MCTTQPSEWVNCLPLAKFWYNTNHHNSIQTSPYEFLYGQSPQNHIPYLAGSANVQAVDISLKARDERLALIKQNLHRAQNMMVQLANSHRSEREFAIGDWAYLRLQPFRQFSLVQKKTHKLSSKYAGPFQVTDRIGSAAYELLLPPNARIHSVFHVSLLKKKDGDSLGSVPLPEALVSAEGHFYPEKVLARTFKKVRNIPVTMWLVKWKDRPEEDASWIPASDCALRFPDFNP